MSKQFPKVTDEQWEILFPKKQELLYLQAKVPYNDDFDTVLIYFDGKDPLFFGYEDADMLPTVYSLWRVPTLMEALFVPSAVSEFILNGADIMLPGVLVPNSIKLFNKNDKRCVFVAGNDHAVCVGKMACSLTEAQKNKWKGRVLITYLLLTFRA